MIRMKDVAAHAKVSVATVSNVETGRKYVSPELEKRVRASMEALGYSVNLVARGLKAKETKTVGVILPDISYMFFPDVLKGIQDAASKSGYTINFLSSEYDFKKEKERVNHLKRSQVDGIIIDSCCSIEQRSAWAKELAGLNIPKKYLVVSLEQELDNRYISCVRVNNYDGMKKSMEYLTGLGCKEIAFLAGPPNIAISQERLNGYLSGLEECGLKIDKNKIIYGDLLSVTAYKKMMEYIDRNISFDAVLAVNDQSAFGAIRALMDKGIDIPRDVKVMGCDNLLISELSLPQITTLNIPKYEMGKKAFEIIHDLIKDPDREVMTCTLKSEIVARRSTDPDCPNKLEFRNW